MNLTTDTDLAAEFGIPLEKFHELRRRRGWPCVKLGRFDVRFTDEQIRQIVEMQSEGPARNAASKPTAIPGQTARSKARGRAS